MKTITQEEFKDKAIFVIEKITDISIENGLVATVICAMLETELFCEDGDTE